MELTYQPGFLISANGDDITARINAALDSLTISDHSGSQADELVLALDGSKIGTLPGKGAVLRVSLGFNGQYYQQGAFVVDDVAVKGWPEVVTIKAKSTPLSGSGGTSLQSQRSQSWDDVTLGDVLKTVAARNQLTPFVSAELASIAIEHIDQTSESDMALMTRLARQYGAVSKVASENWLLLKEGEGKNASGTKKLPVREIAASACSTYSYSSRSRTELKSAVAKWHNQDTGEKGVERQGEGDPALEIAYVYPNKKEARAAVKARAKSVASGSDTFSCTCVATHDLLRAFAEGHIQPVGFRKEITRRAWRIKTLTKQLSKQAGITISFSCDAGTS